MFLEKIDKLTKSHNYSYHLDLLSILGIFLSLKFLEIDWIITGRLLFFICCFFIIIRTYQISKEHRGKPLYKQNPASLKEVNIEIKLTVSADNLDKNKLISRVKSILHEACMNDEYFEDNDEGLIINIDVTSVDSTLMSSESVTDSNSPSLSCCKGGPQWGHAWGCPTLP